MELSKEPDASFTWVIDDFERTLNFLGKEILVSPTFTTSREPNRARYLTIFLKGKSAINLELRCEEKVQEPHNFMVDFSIVTTAGKMYTKSLLISDDKREVDCFTIDNFIDFTVLKRLVCDSYLQVLVEMRFLDNAIQKKSLDDFLRAEIPSDIELSVGGSQFAAHKIILASKSPFFYEAFLEKKEINLDDINPEAFREILNYMYTGEVENWSLVSEILIGASKLQMHILRSTCEQCLGDNLSVDTVIPILKLSEKCSAPYLEERCLSFILNHISGINRSENFYSLKSELGLVLTILKEIFEKSQKVKKIIADCSEWMPLRDTNDKCFEVLKEYEPFLNSSILSDIEIRVGNKKYQCHKLILAARSSVFRGMLMCEMKEALTNIVEIKDVDSDVFYELLRYMYTGKVENLQELSLDILKAADKYDLGHLVNVCEDFLDKNLTHENVFLLIKMADIYNSSFLKERCIYYILKKMAFLDDGREESLISLGNLVKTHPHIVFEILEVLCKLCLLCV